MVRTRAGGVAEHVDERSARFEALVAAVGEPVQRYLGRRCMPADRDGLYNDVLLVLWRRLDDVPADEPLPWVYGVARRCLANHRRSGARHLRLVERARLDAGARHDEPEPPADRPADRHLAALVAGLPELDREIVRLWAWEEMAPREIAPVLDLTPNAVRLRLSRIRRRLGRELRRHDRVAAGHGQVEHMLEPGS